jgi:MFS family permease
MKSRRISNSMNIIQSFKMLKGNTRTSVMFEPLWGIPFVLLNFYLSLYMKEVGITDRQIGYLISLGIITGIGFSLISGVIIDRLGRKKSAFIFDFLSWPLTVVLYAISNSFWMFALATITNSLVRIVSVAWNLMIIEDANNEERVAAFNLLNIINIATGIIIPVAGILVNAYGVVVSERVFLIFAAISMSIMILLRNHFYKETSVGKHLLEEHKKNPVKNSIKTVLPFKAAAIISKKPAAIMVISVFILFNIYIPLGTLNSLYFAPYMTEVLMLGKSIISILGGVYSAAMLLVFVFVVPYISRLNNTYVMISGLIIQGISLFLLTVIPAGNLLAAILCMVLYAVGFGIFRPYIDTLLAEVTEGNDRAGIYAIVNTVTCTATALIGFVSGSMYILNPRLIYIVSIVILVTSVVILGVYLKFIRRKPVNVDTEITLS